MNPERCFACNASLTRLPGQSFAVGFNREILTVTQEGDFLWAENADELIPICQDGATRAILMRLRSADAKPAGQGDGEAVPAGFWLAPMEPTTEMLDRGHHQIDFDRSKQNTEPLVHESHLDELGCGTTIEQDMRDAWVAMRDSWLARHPQTLVHADVELDAARYRWLRQFDVDSYLAAGKGDALDNAIDAARQPSTDADRTG